MTNYPTAWQRRLLWTVVTYLAIVAGGAVAVWLIKLFGDAVGFLQPVLIPSRWRRCWRSCSTPA